VQGGLGGASGNAVAALLGLERALKKQLSTSEKLRIAAEVGSDLPLFLVGGTVLGVRRGEEVYPLPDLPAMACVVATPEIGVSTPKAFADWDAMMEGTYQGLKPDPLEGHGGAVRLPSGQAFVESHPSAQNALGWGTHRRPHASSGDSRGGNGSKLTVGDASSRMVKLGREVSAWLSGLTQGNAKTGKAESGVPAKHGRGRAETLLLDLVRTGIENDFERVVFPQYPELCEVKRLLERAGALYASLSGSGSATYGLFASRAAAVKAATRLRKSGIPAVATTTLTRRQYWKKLRVAD
jgi:4-diphosphocytidyl-2-C-methyl-D-erythritol kinase